jgi:hypothetical protein
MLSTDETRAENPLTVTITRRACVIVTYLLVISKYALFLSIMVGGVHTFQFTPHTKRSR